MNYDLRKFFITALLCCLLGVSACGKVSEPKPLDGSGYPHTYPQH